MSEARRDSVPAVSVPAPDTVSGAPGGMIFPAKRKKAPNGSALARLKFKNLIAQYALETEPITGLSYGELLVAKLFQQAIEFGDLASQREILDRIEGKVPVALDAATAAAMGPISVNIVNYAPNAVPGPLAPKRDTGRMAALDATAENDSNSELGDDLFD